jgi:hypothetical protein
MHKYIKRHKEKEFGELHKEKFLNASCKFTLSHLRESQVLSDIALGYYTSKFFLRAFSNGFIALYENTIKLSMEDDCYWDEVVKSLYDSSDMYSLEWLLNVYPDTKTYILERIGEVGLPKKNRPFALWLHNQGLANIKLTAQDKLFVKSFATKRSRPVEEAEDEQPNKKLKSS